MAERPDLAGYAQSFQPRMWFPHGFDVLGGGRLMWVYRLTGKTCWEVGFFSPDGTWNAESTFAKKEQAAARVNYLNGGRGTDT